MIKELVSMYAKYLFISDANVEIWLVSSHVHSFHGPARPIVDFNVYHAIKCLNSFQGSWDIKAEFENIRPPASNKRGVARLARAGSFLPHDGRHDEV